jgi:exodeoxyribonuclease V beta subunit
MELNFPVGSRDGPRRLVTPGRLGEVLRRHSDLPESYLERLSNLGFAPLEGYLRGFVDLVFEYDGRFFVVDYKSNYLGPRAASYQNSDIASVMSHHHYHLQYHLYLVALHRYLKSRVPGYDYDGHVGGALYLFLRGMARERPPGTGVFASRPSRDCIVALSALFDAPGSVASEATP